MVWLVWISYSKSIKKKGVLGWFAEFQVEWKNILGPFPFGSEIKDTVFWERKA
jgi:hypothetical protein